MNPRLVGALLVVAALAATVSSPAVLGRRTAGTAVMAELPRDPLVGDCVRNLPASFATGPAAGTADPQPVAAAGSSGDPAAPPPTTGSAAPQRSLDRLGPLFAACDGTPADGEVVAVTAAAVDRLTGRLHTPTGIDCRAAALSYAGLVHVDGRFVVPDTPPDDPVAWNLSVNVRSAWVLPSAVMQAQHRTWAACVVAPRDDVPYTGRIAGAFNGGVLPDEFGTCWNARSVSAAIERIDCRSPHLAELVSAGTVVDLDTITAGDLGASCGKLAARVVGRSDPTVGARLVVKTSPETLAADRVVRSVSVLCYLVTPDRPLDASLVGLRDQPLPYAG